MKLVEAGEKTAFIQTAKGEKKTIEYKNDSELTGLKDNQDIKKIDTADGKSIKEESGRKYTAEESQAIGKVVGKSLLKILRAQGDEVVDIRLTAVGLSKFNIKVKYGNDKGHDLFKFKLNPDTESIVLDLVNEPVELVDFIITQGNTVSLPTPELEDKLSDALKKYISEPAEVTSNITEEVIEERSFNITGLGTFEFTGIKDDLVMGSQNNGPIRTFKKEKVLQDNPSFFDRQPREKKPQGIRPYSEAQYRQVLQGAIDDAGSTKFAYDIADSMIYDPQILARLNKDYPGDSAKELKQQLQYDLEACTTPDNNSKDEYLAEKKLKDLTGDDKITMADVLKGRGVKFKNEHLYIGHQDDEPGMLKKDVYRIAKMASMLYKELDKFDNGQEVDFPHWWQAKIIKAYDYLQAAYGYLDAEQKVHQIDNTLVATMALNEKKATYCGRCGHTHLKGTPCPRPFKNEALGTMTKKEVQEVMLEAYIEVLKEAETQPPALKTSTQEILGKFPTVKKNISVSIYT